MADVFLATTSGPGGFQKLQVIKQLREDLNDTSEMREMFLDEARLAARLNHPNVVQTFEVSDSSGEYFMVMEYLDGVPLNRLVSRGRQQNKALPIQLAVHIVSEALLGLHYAHELKDYDGTPLNVVHRDASPHNLFVTYEGQVKVVDFGIAKAALHASETQTGIIKGKTSYMSPEQLSASHGPGSVDRRADLYILGIVLWELLAGAKMWAGKPDAQIFRDLLHGTLPSLREAAPHVPEGLVQICERALARSPDDRYPTALAMRTALLSFASSANLTLDAQELGAYASTLFEDKRRDTQRLIERQLRRQNDPTADASFKNDEETISHLSSLPSLGSGKEPLKSLSQSSSPLTSTSPQVDPSTGARRTWLLGLGAIPLVAAVAFFLHRSTATPAPPPPVASVAPATLPPSPATSASAPAPSDPTSIELVVQATPASAQLWVDGSLLASNPFRGRFKRDGLQHTLKVSASGHDTLQQMISFERDQSLTLELRPTERARAGRTASPATPSATAAAPATTKRALGGDLPAAPATTKRALGDNPF